MDVDLVREAERAAAAWVLGEVDTTEAVRRVCEIVGRAGAVVAAVVPQALAREAEGKPASVPHDGLAPPTDVLGGPPGLRERFVRVARATAPFRTLLTARDDRWAALARDDGLGDARWLACELLRDRDEETFATLVVLGADDGARDDVLPALPYLARVAAAMLGRDRNERATAHALHRMNNLLARVVTNVEFATAILEDDDDAVLSQRDDLAKALGHAREAAALLPDQVGSITRLARARTAR